MIWAYSAGSTDGNSSSRESHDANITAIYKDDNLRAVTCMHRGNHVVGSIHRNRLPAAKHASMSLPAALLLYATKYTRTLKATGMNADAIFNKNGARGLADERGVGVICVPGIDRTWLFFWP